MGNIFKIDEKSDVANYIQLIRQVKEKIVLGQLKTDNQLPSIRILAKELNIAIITIKRAYDELEKEGFIETRQGKGCFVKECEIREMRNLKKQEIKDGLLKIMNDSRIYGFNKNDLVNLINEIEEEDS